jgi:hypothetical protein
MFENLSAYDIWLYFCVAPPLFFIALGIINEIGAYVRRLIGRPVIEGRHYKNFIFGLIVVVAVYYIYLYATRFFSG